MELEDELNKVSFVSAADYYKAIVDVQAKYDVTISETDLIKSLAKKYNS